MNGESDGFFVIVRVTVGVREGCKDNDIIVKECVGNKEGSTMCEGKNDDIKDGNKVVV